MTPTFLVASPQMKDPFFEGTVVLIWHHDEDGAAGVVVNRRLKDMAKDFDQSGRLEDVLVVDDDVDMSSYADQEVSWGGPVHTDGGTIITSGDIAEHDGWKLPEGIAVTRSHDALLKLLREQAPVMLCLGYAGWGPGQLDREVEEGSWIFVDLDPSILFEVPLPERYDQAFKALGIPKELVWMTPLEA